MTYPPRRILVPVDFGAASARALEIASALADTFGAEVEALHVESLSAPPYFTHEQVAALEAQRVRARAAAQRYLVTFAEKHGAGRARSTIAEGAPAEVILSRAQSTDAIVIGTNERSAATRWWMGSVAERVHRESPVPVIVIRASDQVDAAGYAQRLADEVRRRRNG